MDYLKTTLLFFILVFNLTSYADTTTPDLQSETLWISQTERQKWTAVKFRYPFQSAPVVVAGSVTKYGVDPVIVRVRKVTETGFEIKLAEWQYSLDNGYHISEQVAYLAVERGRHRIGDLDIEAFMAGGVNHLWKHYNFDQGFDQAPVVLAQVSSYNGHAPITTRLKNITSTGITLRVQEEEAADQQHTLEVVGVIAITAGVADYRETTLAVGSTASQPGPAWTRISFPTNANLQSPKVVASIQTTHGNDPVTLRHRNISNDGIDVMLQEETSKDSEVEHVSEAIGWIAISSPLVDPVRVVAGGMHTCAISAHDTAQCWGNDGDGRTAVPNKLRNIREVTVGQRHTCYLDDHGVRCEGHNNLGQRSVPYILDNPRQLSGGDNHSCALDDNGVHCWGDDRAGELAVPDDLENPRQISSGRRENCVLDDSGVQCWGGDYRSSLSVPSDIRNPWQISVGGRHTCVLGSSGVQCWGNNESGQTNVPSDLKNPRQVSAGRSHTCALDDNGVRCWGLNSDGQINVPNDLKLPRQVAAGRSHTCALDNSGVRCWGRNLQGQATVPPQTISRYNYNTVNHLLTAASSPYRELKAALTTAIDGSTMAYPTITVSKNNNLSEPAYASSINTDGRLQSITISMNDSQAKPVPYEFWYIVGQSVIDAYMGPPGEQYRCVIENGSTPALIELQHAFADEQSDACHFREAYLQAFVLLMLHDHVSGNELERLLYSGHFPVGNRRQLSAAVARLGWILGSIYSYNAYRIFTEDLDQSEASQTIYIPHRQPHVPMNGKASTRPDNLVVDITNRLRGCNASADHCDVDYIAPEDSCEWVRVGPEGSYELDVAACDATANILCEDRQGNISLTTNEFALSDANSSCPQGSQAVLDLEKENISEFLKTVSVESVLGAGFADGCRMVKSNGDRYQQQPIPYSCDKEARILCKNHSSNSNRYWVTNSRYPLYQADLACEREFANTDPFNVVDDYFVAIDDESILISQIGTDANRNDVLLGTAVVQSRVFGVKRRHSISSIDSDIETIKRAKTNVIAEVKKKTVKQTKRKKNNYLLQVHTLNVGAGSCHVMQCTRFTIENGEPKDPIVESVISDCGSSQRRDAEYGDALTKNGVNSYMLRNGIFLDAEPSVVVSHPDLDHYKYIPDLLEGNNIEKIFAGGSPAHYNERMQNWVQRKMAGGANINNHGSGGNFVNINDELKKKWNSNSSAAVKNFGHCGGAKLEPQVVNLGLMAGQTPNMADKNKQSGVLRLSHNHGNLRYNAILPGDAVGATESAALAKMSSAGGLNNAYNFVAASHHGSKSDSSNSDVWVRGIYPDLVAYSAGRQYGHPSCDVVDLYGNQNLGVAPDHRVPCKTTHFRMHLTSDFNTRNSKGVVSNILKIQGLDAVHFWTVGN